MVERVGQPGGRRGGSGSQWLGLLGLLVTLTWGAEDPHKQGAKPTTGGQQTPLSTVFADLSLKSLAGITATGAAYSGYAYDGRDLLTGSNGLLRMRFARSESLFEAPSQQGGLAALDSGRSAWSVAYQTDPKQQRGLTFAFNLMDVDREFSGGQSLGFGAEVAGLRQQDFKVGWKQGDFAVDVGRDRLVDKTARTGLSRELLATQAFGFTYRRERLTIDDGARFDSALTARLLGASGYDLAKRKLGEAKAGYSGLTDLAGLTDAYEAGGFAHGDLALGFHERRLAVGSAQLLDRKQKLSFGGFEAWQSTRQLDAAFEGYRAAGYADWARLSGGREDQTGAQLQLTQLGASWTRTRLFSNPTGAEGAGIITESEEQKLLLTPVKPVALSYRRLQSRSGSEKLWELENQAGLTTTDDAMWQAGLTLDQHKLNWSLRSLDQNRPGFALVSREQAVSYTLGRRTQLRFSERSEDRTVETKKSTTVTASRMQTMALDTAFGLSALRERGRTDDEPSSHDRVRFDRKVGRRYEVALGYERWEQMAAPRIAVAGYSGLLAKPVTEATWFDWSATVRPGTTELTAFQRSLSWEQAKKTTEWAAGQHRLSETGVQVAQAVSGEFGVKARWSRYDRDHELDLERREVAVTYAPKAKLAILPSAEFGYRELRDGEGDVKPALYAAAKVRPVGGLELRAQFAQSQPAGAVAVVEDWYEAERHAVQLAATQAIGKNGSASLTYSEVPVAPRYALEDGETIVRAKDVAVAFTSPAEWLAGKFQLRGKYRTRFQPGYGDDTDQRLQEHEASLLWKPGQGEELSATYRLRWSLDGVEKDGDGRFEFQYSRSLADAKLAVTGFWQGHFDPYYQWNADERFRFGVNYSMPF